MRSDAPLTKMVHRPTMDEHAPGVSVALATYNGARYLDEQLASLAAQTVLSSWW
jgi:hypothetical protein